MQACLRTVSKVCKSAGRKLDKMGERMQGDFGLREELCPSSRILSFCHTTPVVTDAAFIAPSATVSGDVVLGKNSSVWYGGSIRGDVASIWIGSNTHLRDNVVIHVDSLPHQVSTVVGNNCVIGIDNGAVLHACSIDDNCLIGEGAIVLDGVHIQQGAAIAPGSIVTPRKTVGKGEMWSGVPARKVRNLTPEEQAEIQSMCDSIAKAAVQHYEETSKNYEQLVNEEAEAEDTRIRDITYAYNPNPNSVNPNRRGLIYDRLPAEMDEVDDTPAVVLRSDARKLEDMTYDVVEADEKDYEDLPILPDHDLKQ